MEPPLQNTGVPPPKSVITQHGTQSAPEHKTAAEMSTAATTGVSDVGNSESEMQSDGQMTQEAGGIDLHAGARDDMRVFHNSQGQPRKRLWSVREVFFNSCK